MFHGPRLVVVVLIGFAVLGAAADRIGPFGSRPDLAYTQFLADFEAGHVEQIVQWRDRLEVTEAGEAFQVVVPEATDIRADLAAARAAGGVGLNYSVVPDNWVMTQTPWVPATLLVAGLVVWLRALLRRPSPTDPSQPGILAFR